MCSQRIASKLAPTKGSAMLTRLFKALRLWRGC
jgi:hypothetical protein